MGTRVGWTGRFDFIHLRSPDARVPGGHARPLTPNSARTRLDLHEHRHRKTGFQFLCAATVCSESAKKLEPQAATGFGGQNKLADATEVVAHGFGWAERWLGALGGSARGTSSQVFSDTPPRSPSGSAPSGASFRTGGTPPSVADLARENRAFCPCLGERFLAHLVVPPKCRCGSRAQSQAVGQTM